MTHHHASATSPGGLSEANITGDHGFLDSQDLTARKSLGSVFSCSFFFFLSDSDHFVQVGFLLRCPMKENIPM